jgi:tetratricopeptide (TPR) repeat protein
MEDPMAAKTTLNAKNLETLGAPALAALLIEISTGSAAAKRRLRLALAGGQGAREAAAEIAKRLATITRSRSTVTYKRRRALIDDLATQLQAISDVIAPSDTEAAVELLWRFMGLANGVLDRCEDSSGAVMAQFLAASAALGRVAEGQPAEKLADAMVDALLDNGYGQYDRLLADLAQALGAAGLAYLKALFVGLSQRPVPVPAKADWQKVGYGATGAVYAHDVLERNRLRTVDLALRQIADLQGDADAFIARHVPETRQLPAIAVEIATRLLAVGRADEALQYLDRADVDDARYIPLEWQEARVAALEALGRSAEAQDFRWHCFARALSIPHLRAHLKRLPDFEDIEAETRAMAYGAQFSHAMLSLSFFTGWPDLPRAAALVLARGGELDGEHYDILTSAANVLADGYPLAATVVLRCMIDFALTKSRSARYAHAGRHLADCAILADRIDDFGPLVPHFAYVTRLRAVHGKKAAFWTAVH